MTFTLPAGLGWIQDGQWLVDGLGAGGASDLGLLHVAVGTTRRLTAAPGSEEGAEFTPDGRTVLFRRVESVQRIATVDLSKVLAAKRRRAEVSRALAGQSHGDIMAL